MKEVLMYQANDGKLFTTAEEAKDHDILIELGEWYQDNKLYGNYAGSRVEWRDFLEWVKENSEQVQKLLSIL